MVTKFTWSSVKDDPFRIPFDPDGVTLATFVTAFEAAALNAAEVPTLATVAMFRDGGYCKSEVGDSSASKYSSISILKEGLRVICGTSSIASSSSVASHVIPSCLNPVDFPQLQLRKTTRLIPSPSIANVTMITVITMMEILK